MTVTEAGGFAPAQSVLNVSQSTISTQMADLETRLGFTLCRRGRGGFALTEDGRAVYEAATELFRACSAFSAQVGERRGVVTGELRLAVADSLVGNPDFPFERVLARLRRRMPQVTIVLNEADPLTIERHVLQGRLHAGVHTFPNQAPGLRYLPLFRERQTLYCGRGHPLFARPEKSLSVDQLERCDYAARTYYGGALQTRVLRPEISTAQSSTMDGIVALLLSGNYIAHLPWRRAERWVRSGLLRPLMRGRLCYNTLFECAMPRSAGAPRSLELFEEVMRASFPEGATKTPTRTSPT